MKVEIELRNGRRVSLPKAYADVVVKRKRGTYLTRDMRAEPSTEAAVVASPEVSELDALKAEADRRGIKYHHRAGVAKLRELLEG